MWSSSSEDEENPPKRRRIFRERINGNFQSVYEFNERFRMNAVKMEQLHEDIGHILFHPTNRSQALPSKLQLCIGLHWLGNGGQYHVIADAHGVSKASVCRCVKSVVNSVNEVKFSTVIKWPENVLNVSAKFFAVAHFPQVIGCVDGTLIKIDAPPAYESAFVDRNGNHSINCMIVCGPNMEIYFVSAKWPGSVHDARVLRNSSLFRTMEGGWRPIPNAIILGDSGYPLLQWLITPTINCVHAGSLAFNRAHKKTRRIVENAFGILKEKFPCLNYLRLSPIYAANVFKCCATLCNISREGEYIDLPAVNHEEPMENEIVEEVNHAPPARQRL
ncbi:putative nuclease HARBI1 [Bacillus rossius redtenbacheri]|uniref:putative nuclease HARBI1 n=1 Tax=Bacillus rossius redtenbacheri TaxID=93214 RepID=UPI002FDEE5B0